jgi:hypothetical protein
MKREIVKISRIRQDFGTQVRAHVRQDVINDYAEMMSEGARFPPVDVFEHGKFLILADGFNRLAATIKNGHKEIEAVLHKGNPVDALVFAAGANSKHGLQRTREDKIKTVTMLLQEPAISDKSDRAVAEMANVGGHLVAMIRKQVEGGTEEFEQQRTRIGRDGKKRQAKARQPGEDAARTRKDPDAPVQGAMMFDLRAFNASIGAVARHVDQLARDFGHVHPKSLTIKETLEHRGIRRKLEEVAADVTNWRKQMEREQKNAAKTN